MNVGVSGGKQATRIKGHLLEINVCLQHHGPISQGGYCRHEGTDSKSVMVDCMMEPFRVVGMNVTRL